MGLAGAIEAPDAPEHIKNRARDLLAAHPGEPSEEWVQSVYAYFRNCYSPDGVDRNVSRCLILKGERPPVDLSKAYAPARHLAYLFVRQFVPDHRPRVDLIEAPPEWGEPRKPTPVFDHSNITRARYLAGEISHHDYYGAIVELLGEDSLRHWLPVSHTPVEWAALIAEDEHLNNVSLHQWDACDPYVRSRVACADRAALKAITGSDGWSLGDSVCVLKTTARRYALEASR
jgi:hypothetical protein